MLIKPLMGLLSVGRDAALGKGTAAAAAEMGKNFLASLPQFCAVSFHYFLYTGAVELPASTWLSCPIIVVNGVGRLIILNAGR